MKQVSAKTRAQAKHLRSTLTDAEQKLWTKLRRKGLRGCRFRRQVPIKGYIADFVCHQQKLVIEVDGGQHTENADYDAYRTKILKSEGYRVLRFWNNDVLQNIEGALETILTALEAAPPPNSSPRAGEDLKN